MLIHIKRYSTDYAIDEEQCSFRSGRGCLDMIFAVSQGCEKYLARKEVVFCLGLQREKEHALHLIKNRFVLFTKKKHSFNAK